MYSFSLFSETGAMNKRPENPAKSSMMTLLHEPAYWLLLAGCLGVASIPALMRSIGKMRLVAIAALWLALCAATLWRFGAMAGVVTTLISGAWGAVLLVTSLLFSGIKSMPNQRFEER